MISDKQRRKVAAELRSNGDLTLAQALADLLDGGDAL